MSHCYTRSRSEEISPSAEHFMFKEYGLETWRLKDHLSALFSSPFYFLPWKFDSHWYIDTNIGFIGDVQCGNIEKCQRPKSMDLLSVSCNIPPPGEFHHLVSCVSIPFHHLVHLVSIPFFHLVSCDVKKSASLKPQNEKQGAPSNIFRPTCQHFLPWYHHVLAVTS